MLTKNDLELQEAREIARGCPTGCVVVSEMGKDNVFYKHVYTNKEITTDFTADQVETAHRDIPPIDQDHLEWDHGNSMAQNKYQVYKVKGK
jgi:hypothetical protein